MSKLYDIHQKVTENIISKFETAGSWQKLWEVPAPMNLNGRPYQGINYLLLAYDAHPMPVYGTFNQIRQNGGQVKKGEKSTIIVFWSFQTEIDPATGKSDKKYFLKFYNVFNVGQAEFDEIGQQKIRSLASFNDNPVIHAADDILNSMPAPPLIYHDKSDRASYLRVYDRIRIPDIGFFTSSDEYYHCLFHELVHSTGHSSRLNRFAVYKDFSDDQLTGYSKEELVAELGASFLSAHAGLNPPINNSAAYIRGWSARLKDNATWIMWAANRAHEAVSYILQNVTEEVPA